MTEEKNQENVKFYPEPVVRPIIYNEKGEVLLIQCPMWEDYWHIPGGHIELGETSEHALKREIKEKIGLELDNIEFIGWQDAIELETFHKKKHFIFFNYCARMSSGKMIKSDEVVEYKWILPDEALKILKIHSTTIKTIKFYLNHIENKKENFSEKYKHALADYQNLLKQTAKEKMEFVVYANEQMLKEILPVYDHLKMAIEYYSGESSDNWLKGVQHVVKQFKDVLEKIGVEEIKIKDKKFDHNLMEAVGSEETEDENLDGQVAKQVKAGYKLNGKVIEAAKVVVYKLKIGI